MAGETAGGAARCLECRTLLEPGFEPGEYCVRCDTARTLADVFERANARMTRLVRAFPSLAKGAPRDVVPWTGPDSAVALDAWKSGPAATSESLAAARFVLAVWSGGPAEAGGFWRVGAFDLVDAWSVLDDLHRRAIVWWLRNPWWP